MFVASLDMRTSTYVMVVLVLNGLRWEVITCTRFVDIAGIVDRLKLLFIVNNHNCNKRKLYLIKSLKWALMWNIHQSNLINIRFLKVSIYQLCRKQLTKLANLLMHSQCALSEPISSSRKTRKLTVCRFI